MGLLSLLVLIILGGCHMENKSEVATKESQITFLKAHEKEMTEYIKSQNNKIESVQYDWNSVEVGTIGNGLPQGGEKVMTMSGKFNELQNSSFMLSFGITKEQIDYLVENGKMPVEEMLDDVSISKLREMAKEKKIKGYSKMTKEELKKELSFESKEETKKEND